MKLDDMILVSIDDHVSSRRHVRAPRAGEVPRPGPEVVVADDGIEQWVFQGSVAGTIGLNAVVAWPKEDWGFDPTTFAEMRPGAYDVHERVRDMNRNGSSRRCASRRSPGSAAALFQEAADKDLALVVVQAYNDWHIDEWCGAYPGRFIPLAIPPIWDPQAGRRDAPGRGQGLPRDHDARAAAHQGLPSYHNLDYWDPFFERCRSEQS